jgi:hypothetical protein
MRFPSGLGGAFWAPMAFAAPDPPGWPFKPLRCPRCLSRDCARGLPAGALDRWHMARGRIPHECRGCGKRFRFYVQP